MVRRTATTHSSRKPAEPRLPKPRSAPPRECGKARRQEFCHGSGQCRSQNNRRRYDDTPIFRRLTDEMAIDDCVDDVGHALDARHRRTAEGLSETVAAAGERGADQDDPAGELVGHHPPGQKIGEGEARKGVARSAIIDQQPHRPIGQHRKTADADAGAERKRDLRPGDAEIGGRLSQARAESHLRTAARRNRSAARYHDHK